MPDRSDIAFQRKVSQFINRDLVISLFKGCQTKLLVVTDGMMPQVIEASRGGALPLSHTL
jgi:hypothetical protein